MGAGRFATGAAATAGGAGGGDADGLRADEHAHGAHRVGAMSAPARRAAAIALLRGGAGAPTLSLDPLGLRAISAAAAPLAGRRTTDFLSVGVALNEADLPRHVIRI
jgi:hypothetical protein